MALASAIARRSLGTGDRGNDLCQSREIVGAEQRAAGRHRHDRIDASEACPCGRKPLDSLAVYRDIDILVVLAAPAVDHIEGPSAQRMERMRHLRVMNFTLPIMCIARWFRMAPPRCNWRRSPSSPASPPWFPLPRRHVTRYSGVLSSHAGLRSEVVPPPATLPLPSTDPDKPGSKARYITWAQLLRRTFSIEILCPKCRAQMRLIALIKSEEIAKKILTAMHLPTEIPELHPARPPPGSAGEAGGEDRAGSDWLN